MPRPNQPRKIATERVLAKRVAQERERRGWSYDGLASRMTQAGCAIQPSAIYKIEKSDPPRRITVDELMGFASAFGLPVHQLLVPPELAAREKLVRLLSSWDEARDEASRATERSRAAFNALQRHLADQHVPSDDLESVISAWVDHQYGGEVPSGAFELTMYRLTESKSWAAKYKAANPDLYFEELS